LITDVDIERHDGPEPTTQRPPPDDGRDSLLDFWQRELDGKLHSVRVATLPVIQAPSVRNAGACLTLH
jgi:hypothetical protein